MAEVIFEPKGGEEEAIIQAINLILGSKMATTDDATAFKNIVRDVFPNSVRPRSGVQRYSSMLVNTINEQLRQENLQPTQEMVNKVLYHVLCYHCAHMKHTEQR